MYAELFRLDGRAALVTGESRGTGLACAETASEVAMLFRASDAASDGAGSVPAIDGGDTISLT